ncbi:MAG: prolyl oligopeptidase family serine peptidase [Bacteroidota bacterium]
MKKILNLAMLLTTVLIANAQEDPYQWLEEVDNEKALEWVEDLNANSLEEIMAYEGYQDIFDKNLEIYNSKENIASPSIIGDYIYNFWKDENYIRGVWRRTKKSAYLNGEPEWETLINLDKLSDAEGEKYVWKGASGLYPDYERFMVNLSKGGGDATIKREFNVETKKFVEGGFNIPESKGSASWINENLMIVSAVLNPEEATTSGYSNQAALWKRGTDVNDAEVIFTGNKSDVGSWGYTFRDGDKVYTAVTNAPTFYTRKIHIMNKGKLVPMDIPEDASMQNLLGDEMIVELKSDWDINGETYKQGSVISLSFQGLLAGKHQIKKLVEPSERSSIMGVSATKSGLVVSMLNNVRSELFRYQLVDGEWEKTRIDAPDFGTIQMGSMDEDSEAFFFYYQNFLTPSTLYYTDLAIGEMKAVQSAPAFFDSKGFEVNQYEATSKDGTKIPYFVVSKSDIKLDGSNPTLLYAYGGFEVSQRPFYSSTMGTAWLERGGVYVLANIRGGGEFGPKWHQAGLKENRQRVFNDFHAVAGDIINKKITSPKHLGIRGGSNGGLLIGVAITQRPDLYGAAICAVPLLDMKRYNKLLAGASWMGEYGDPDDPKQWAYIARYSPYHNLKEAANYPEVFFTTSTRDDRVHPGHARKMAAKMIDMGYKIYYYENTEGGHAGSSTNDQFAKSLALQYSYLWMKLK